jgi:hypothetical protein
VDPVAFKEEQALRAQLAQASERLDGLARKLRSVDGELEGLSGERQQHRLLTDACSALEQLDELGGASLFWGERASNGEVVEHIRGVRGRVDAFQKRLGEIEDRRQALLDEIDAQQAGAWTLADELVDAEEEARRREQEWVVEREVDVFPVHALVMPWMRNGEEDRRFRRSLAIAMTVTAFYAALIPWIDLPLPELAPRPPATERLTRLIPEQRPVPAPPPVTPAVQPPEQKLAEQTKTPKPKEGPGQGPGQGPGSGPGAGILAFREKLSDFAQNQNLSRLGAQAKVAPGAESGPVQRAMLTTQAPGSSGGINLSELSRNVGGGGAGAGGRIDGVQIARATSTIAGGGGGAQGPSARGGPGPGRTDEEIQIVFDRHKSALYRLYNRELRQDPTLKGQMVLRIRIEPDGSVTLCELQGTDMRAPQLVAQVLERVRTFDFGAKAVPAITILYPIDFLPAT